MRQGKHRGQRGGALFAWNTGGLRADLGLVRKGWDELDAEALSANCENPSGTHWFSVAVSMKKAAS